MTLWLCNNSGVEEGLSSKFFELEEELEKLFPDQLDIVTK